MNPIEKYFSGGCSISLENVTYNKLDEIDDEVSLSVKDNLEIKEDHSSNNIELLISRHLTFEPKSLVDINVSFGVVMELDSKFKGDTQLDHELLKKELLNNDNVIMPIIMSRISLLISQLTSSYGERPIITPPTFMITD